ncbi:LuxR C-terminal-related transcriptional regulator [Dongia sp.]|uniref:LuxR C-terminal-related transcriptional regulator n=1 Tax=Dongia sp. TaxID=1977262 RepID=UPI00374FEDC6
MQVAILTPVRLLGEGLVAGLARCDATFSLTLFRDIAALHAALPSQCFDIALIDMTQETDLMAIRTLAVEWPALALVALGLREQRQDVIRCGRAGFRGYVARDASIEELGQALSNVATGRLACPSEISAGLLRALFDGAGEAPEDERNLAPNLTQREREVLVLVGRGMSNKEIARDLSLSVATVKHHVHNLLDKMQVSRRSQAMRRVQEKPWLASLRVSTESFGGLRREGRRGT